MKSFSDASIAKKDLDAAIQAVEERIKTLHVDPITRAQWVIGFFAIAQIAFDIYMLIK